MFFYNILIQPIEYMVEVIFTIMNRFFNSEGYAIIAMSVFVSTLVLPLYLRGDAIQEKERIKQESMKKWMDHIRKTFKGEERYMMQAAYYKQQDYRPLYTLRGVIPILLQIPFFIAAYHFLSTLGSLQGVSFGFLPDLGAEDRLIPLGTVRANLLPVLMTAINLVSAFIYTRGFSWKERIQPVVLALIFLVLLYRSPSGLVLYWTMNNLYSLIKNIVTKLFLDPGKLFRSILLAAGIAFGIYLAASGRIAEKLAVKDRESLMIYMAIIFLLCLPLILSLLSGLFKGKFKGKEKKEVPAERISTAILLEAALTVLYGLVIPFLVIAVNPQDFLALDKTVSPLSYAVYTTTVWGGVFLVWGSIIWLLADEKGREIHNIVMLLLLVLSLVNVMGFNAAVGNVSAMLEFDFLPHFNLKTKMINLLLIAVISLALIFLWKLLSGQKLRRIRQGAVAVILLSLTAMAAKDIYTTKKDVDSSFSDTEEAEYVIPLSKNGRNVVVIMLDRAISGFVPYIFSEKPELKASYEGFVYYPNTLSYGDCTQTGAPGLYGGYDYSTEAIQAREEEVSLPDQHDHALLTMPIIFGEAGWDVTVVDPPIVHWKSVTDLDMFRQYPNTNAFELYGTLPTGYSLETYKKARYRNFVFYSLYRSMPAMLQDEVYDKGGYCAADREDHFIGEQAFRYGYTALKNLPILTEVREDGDYFIDLCNQTTHGGALLSLPDYDVEKVPDYTGIDIAADKTAEGKTMHFDRGLNMEFSVGQYHSNMATYMILAKWLDDLKEWGVYDNTRIIFVSDHGFWLENFDYMTLEIGPDLEAINALLMVKDFNSREPLRTDDTFMCNADTPSLAMEGMIEDPVNPFTGNPINMDGKKDGLNILWTGGSRYQAEPRYEIAKKRQWFHVKDNIFDINNWEKLDK